jgi:hypothetical protein
MPKEKMKPAVKYTIGFLILGVIVGGIIWGIINLQSVDTIEEGDEEEAATTYIIDLQDYCNPENNDEIVDAATITWYKYDYSEVDEEDIDSTLQDLIWTDFSVDGTGDELTPDVDTAYIAKINGSDLVPAFYSTDIRLFEGNLPLLTLGHNNVSIMNMTADEAMLAFSTDSMSSTINQTDYRDWTIVINSLDASEGTTAEIDNNQGYLPYYNPETPEFYSLVVEFEYNVTAASTSYVELQSAYVNREVASGAYVYVEVDIPLYGSKSLEFRLSSVLGTTFEIIGIKISYGYAESNTDWDSQN